MGADIGDLLHRGSTVRREYACDDHNRNSNDIESDDDEREEGDEFPEGFLRLEGFFEQVFVTQPGEGLGLGSIAPEIDGGHDIEYGHGDVENSKKGEGRLAGANGHGGAQDNHADAATEHQSGTDEHDDGHDADPEAGLVEEVDGALGHDGIARGACLVAQRGTGGGDGDGLEFGDFADAVPSLAVRANVVVGLELTGGDE